MAITDFNKRKKLDVQSVSGTPTISHAVPIKITSGDDSTTGTGEIVLDWTNISSESDIGIYDENDNLLDYYIESFDTGSLTAVIHVYRAWDQDGSTQCKVAYGNGPSDQSDSASTVFDKETNLQAGYLLNESSGDALDVTSNNNDGSVYGVPQDEPGQVGSAYDFDGIDDYVTIPSLDPTSYTVSMWIKPETGGRSTPYDNWAGGSGANVVLGFDRVGNRRVLFDAYDGSTTNYLKSSSLSLGSWYHIIATYDSGTQHLYIDSSLDEAIDEGNTLSGDASARNEIIGIGAKWDGSGEEFDGQIDEVRIYNSALSSDEITAKYDSSKSTPSFFSQQAVETTPTFLTGAVTLDGSAIQGADVYAYNDTDSSFVGKTTTDANGDYSIPATASQGSGDVILIAIDYEDQGNYYGDEKSTVL